jgi:hypothetical protein
MAEDWDFIVDGKYSTGWIDDQEAVAEVMSELPQPMFQDTGLGDISLNDLPKEVIPNKFAQSVISEPWLKLFNQGSVGSCVGHGSSRAAEITNLCEIANGDNEELKYISRMVVYGGSRVNVNGGRSPFRSDGSVGAWAAKWCNQFGLLAMEKYLDKYDLSVYSPSICREWGAMGVPKDLLPLAKEHFVSAVTMVTNVDDARKALFNGHGISVCSNQGFNVKRDRNGICSPSGSWSHSMAIIGYLHIGDVLYFLIENSWGDYLKGSPAPVNSNDGTFLAKADVVQKMLSQKDSFAYAGVNGFKRKDNIDWNW